MNDPRIGGVPVDGDVELLQDPTHAVLSQRCHAGPGLWRSRDMRPTISRRWLVAQADPLIWPDVLGLGGPGGAAPPSGGRRGTKGTRPPSAAASSTPAGTVTITVPLPATSGRRGRVTSVPPLFRWRTWVIASACGRPGWSAGCVEARGRVTTTIMGRRLPLDVWTHGVDSLPLLLHSLRAAEADDLIAVHHTWLAPEDRALRPHRHRPRDVARP